MVAFSPLEAIDDEPQDDPRLMTPLQLREYARSGGMPTTIAALARQALRGGRRYPNRWIEPLHQSGFSCQTVAVVNGVRCYQAVIGGMVWDPTPKDIEEIRRVGGIYEGHGRLAQTARCAAEAIKNMGLLRSSGVMLHPLEAVGNMADDGFAVLNIEEDWHAITVMPNNVGLTTPDGIEPDLITIDSLTGGLAAMSAESGLLTTVLSRVTRYSFAITSLE